MSRESKNRRGVQHLPNQHSFSAENTSSKGKFRDEDRSFSAELRTVTLKLLRSATDLFGHKIIIDSHL